jgi:hypothetical protein
MMVVFQRKIIYMGALYNITFDTCLIQHPFAKGYVPLGARTEELRRDVLIPAGLICDEITVESERRVKLAGLVVTREEAEPDVVVVYLQGAPGVSMYE